MSEHWTTQKVVSGLGDDGRGNIVEVNIFTVFLSEFDETKTFTIPEGDENQLTRRVEDWLKFRRSISD